MKMRNGDPLSPDMLAQLKRLEAMRDEDIDTRDMLEVTDWAKAVRWKYYRLAK